jgi:hypothetical protein
MCSYIMWDYDPFRMLLHCPSVHRHPLLLSGGDSQQGCGTIAGKAEKQCGLPWEGLASRDGRERNLSVTWSFRCTSWNMYIYMYIYIFNRNWVDTGWQQYITHLVDTRWQQYITHLHTNSTHNTEKEKLGSVGRAPSLRVIPWHLPYNWGKSTEKPQLG